MSAGDGGAKTPTPIAAPAPAGRMRWWGGTVVDGEPPKRRWVIRWGRIGAAFGVLCLIGYLGLATALWAYYTTYRKIPGVQWVDIAVLPRFPRVQAAIGAHYLTLAREYWQKREYTAGLLTARAAVGKAPENLEARLFLAACWQEAGRFEEALRVLRDGLARHANEDAFQKVLVAVCLAGERHEELLKLLRDELPARGVRLLADGGDPLFAVAEMRAVLETAGPEEAWRLLETRPGLAATAAAAPLAARIEWDLGRRDAAFARLGAALVRDPGNAGVHDAYIDTALRLGKTDTARTAAAAFLKSFPEQPAAQLKYLEAHGDRAAADRVAWLTETLRYLVRHRQNPAALQRLADLASTRGWADLTYLLYEHHLGEGLSGFPFAVFHVVALVRAGRAAEADAAWRELSDGGAERLAPYPHIAALVAWGAGRQPEALETVRRIRRDLASDDRRAKALGALFRRLEVLPLAEAAEAPVPGAP